MHDEQQLFTPDKSILLELFGARKNDILIGTSPETLNSKLVILNGVIPIYKKSTHDMTKKLVDKYYNILSNDISLFENKSKDDICNWLQKNSYSNLIPMDSISNIYISILDYGDQSNLFYRKLSPSDRSKLKTDEPRMGWKLSDIRAFFNKSWESSTSDSDYIFKYEYWRLYFPIYKYINTISVTNISNYTTDNNSASDANYNSYTYANGILDYGVSLYILPNNTNKSQSFTIEKNIKKYIIKIDKYIFCINKTINKSLINDYNIPSILPLDNDSDTTTATINNNVYDKLLDMPINKIINLFTVLNYTTIIIDIPNVVNSISENHDTNNNHHVTICSKKFITNLMTNKKILKLYLSTINYLLICLFTLLDYVRFENSLLTNYFKIKLIFIIIKIITQHYKIDTYIFNDICQWLKEYESHNTDYIAGDEKEQQCHVSIPFIDESIVLDLDRLIKTSSIYKQITTMCSLGHIDVSKKIYEYIFISKLINYDYAMIKDNTCNNNKLVMSNIDYISILFHDKSMLHHKDNDRVISLDLCDQNKYCNDNNFSWIGHIDVKCPSGKIITVVPHINIKDFIYVEKNNVHADVSNEDKSYCVNYVIGELTDGILISDDNEICTLINGEYYINDVLWKEYLSIHQQNKLLIYNSDNLLFETSASTSTSTPTSTSTSKQTLLCVLKKIIPNNSIEDLQILVSTLQLVEDDTIICKEPIYSSNMPSLTKYILDTKLYVNLLTLSHIVDFIDRVNMETFIIKNYNILYLFTLELNKYILGNNPTVGDASDTTHNLRWNKRDIYDKTTRECFDYQIKILDRLKSERQQYNKRYHMMWLTVGMGKTKIIMEYVKYLSSISMLPKYIIYTCPHDALEVVINEITKYTIDVSYYSMHNESSSVSIRSFIQKSAYKNSTIKLSNSIEEYHINICTHESARYISDEIASQCILLVDEVHRTFNCESILSKNILRLASYCKESVIFTGTPTTTNMYSLRHWIRLVTNQKITKKNIIAITLSMLDKYDMTFTNVSKFYLYKNKHIIINDLVPYVVELTSSKYSRRVMVIVKNNKEMKDMKAMISKANSKLSILTMTSGINLSKNAVKDKTKPHYDVVITTIKRLHGYSLSYMNTLLSINYKMPLNNKIQLEGRINRVDQTDDLLYIYLTNEENYESEYSDESLGHHNRLSENYKKINSIEEIFEEDI